MIKVSLLLPLLFVYSILVAQKFTWVNQIKGSGSNHIWSTVVDSQGNVISTGRVQNGASVVTEDSITPSVVRGTHDFFLTKFDAQGNLIFSIISGNSATEVGYGVTTDHEDNIIVMGSMPGSTTFYDALGDSTVNHGGGGNAFVVKYTPMGEFVWIKTIGSTDGSGVLKGNGGVSVDSENNVYISGAFSGTFVESGETMVSTNNSEDAFLIKLDADGNYIWCKQAGWNLDDGGGRVVLKDDVVYWYGNYRSNASFDSYNLSLSGLNSFVAKLDTSGIYSWVVDTPTRISLHTGLYVDSLHDIYICGVDAARLTFCRLDSSGNFDLTVKYLNQNANALSYCESIFYDETNQEILLGARVRDTIYNGNDTIFGGESDAYILAFDTLGNLSWTKKVEGYLGITGKWTTGRNILIDQEGYLIFTGEFVFNTVFDDFVFNAPNRTDVFISRLSPYTDVSISPLYQEICLNDTANFSVNKRGIIDDLSYDFNGGDIVYANDDSVGVVFSNPDTYDLEVLFENQWESKTKDYLSVAQVKPIPVSGLANFFEVCPGDSVLAQPNAGYDDYTWYGIIDTSTQNLYLQLEGQYYLDILGANGCVSTDTLELSYYDLPDLPEILQNGNELTSSVTADTYQWFLNGEEIPGAISQSFTASESGSYSVQISNIYGCKVLSDPFSFSPASALSYGSDSPVLIYPNPADNFVNIHLVSEEITNVYLYDNTGKLVKEIELDSNIKKINLSEFSTGIYTLVFDFNHTLWRTKLVIQ